MKMFPIECPNCKSKLKIEEGRDMIFCEYCGTQIFVDDGVVRSEHVERKIDEARLKEAEVKRDIAKLEYKKQIMNYVLVVFLILLMVFLLMSIPKVFG